MKRALLLVLLAIVGSSPAFASRKFKVTFDSEGGPQDAFNQGFGYTWKISFPGGQMIMCEHEVLEGQSPENAAADLANDIKEKLVEGGVAADMDAACAMVWQHGETVKVKGVKEGGIKGEKDKVHHTTYGKNPGFALLTDGDLEFELSRDFPGGISFDGLMNITVAGISSAGATKRDSIDVIIPFGLDDASVDALVFSTLAAAGWGITPLGNSAFHVSFTPSVTDIRAASFYTEGDPNFFNIGCAFE